MTPEQIAAEAVADAADSAAAWTDPAALGRRAVERMASRGLVLLTAERAAALLELERRAQTATEAERERCFRLIERRRARASGKAERCYTNGNMGQLRVHQAVAEQLALALMEIEHPVVDAANQHEAAQMTDAERIEGTHA